MNGYHSKLLILILSVAWLHGQEAQVPSSNDASLTGSKNARVINLAIPAPRGQILARNGEPFAQNIVTHQLALMFPQFENPTQEFIVSWSRTRMGDAAKLIPKIREKSDAELWDHYQNRRWLPLYLTGFIPSERAESVREKLGKRDDLILQPVYRRFYPNSTSAAHIVGYTGSVGKLSTGPINYNDPMWELSEGRAGLEKYYDKELRGQDGMKRIVYDKDGVKSREEIVKRPRAGGNVVTTLDMKWQRKAEEALADGCSRGAIVCIDISTGEILAMATRPTFDLDEFVGGISIDQYKALQEDPNAPLISRAFSAAYPPASTFKSVVALAALHDGIVTEHTEIYAPATLELKGRKIRNANRRSPGEIDIKMALALSTNTWFAKVGMDCGYSNFLSLARRMGYGEKTDLPLIGEVSGNVPTNEYMLAHANRRITSGDTANYSIGQGELEATPLQVAQGMAAVGNGIALPKLQLIRQIQDLNGQVTYQLKPEVKRELGTKMKDAEIVHEGMHDVVNESYGTGKQGALSWTTLCGKTGTGQWHPSKGQYVAWFAGFLPYDNPRFAFAVLYEGKPNQSISGGKNAAPIVRQFFNSLRNEIEEIITEPKKADVVKEDKEEITTPKAIAITPPGGGIPKAIAISEDTDIIPPEDNITTTEQTKMPKKEETPKANVDPNKTDEEESSDTLNEN